MDYQPYQPYNRQYPQDGQSPFAKASMVTGVIALLTILTGVLPLVFGSLSILFAVLSRKKNTPMESRALWGSIFGSIGLALATAMIAISITLIPTILKDPEYRAQLNATTESMYGVSFDVLMEESYGIDIDKLLDIN